MLVLGAGSVGKRHMSNFAALGCKLSAMDPLPERLSEASEQVNLVRSYTDTAKALQDSSLFDGVIVASPPKYHVQQCLEFIEKDVPILLEKPISPFLQDGLSLNEKIAKNKAARILMGYTYRWWPPLRELKKELRSRGEGRILHAQFVMSAHLADWHPWERYQDFFMSSKELGGGALLDESHFLDLMVWFFGLPEWVFAKVEKISSLEIETDDNVDMLAGYEDGLRVSMHLDLYGRPHEKYILIEGENGTIRWSFEPNIIQFSCNIQPVWQTRKFEYERNDMFVEVAREFLQVIAGKLEMSCTLQDGLEVLRIIEACRRSSDTGRVIYLKDIV